jgi:hypothetical protein
MRVHAVSTMLLVASVLGTRQVETAPGDPPPRVARLSYLAGSVSFEPSGDTAWGQATLNYPVTIGDRVYADEGARAELQVGAATFRLAGNTDVTMTNLTGTLAQLGVSDGTVRTSVYDLSADDTIEIDTPNGTLSILAPGAYRVEVDADDSTTLVSVDSGSLSVATGGPAETVRGGNAIQLSGTNPIGIATAPMPPGSSFDQWSAERDEHASGEQYVSSDLPGASDLDAAGHWEDSPDGAVWYPVVAAGWVPYRYGHWVWIDPWGWTWVEDEWWGFTPFHYGRWEQFGARWGWVPGPLVRRACYAPALVVFVDGSQFTAARTWGRTGVQAWFPLGPREPYYPWYHSSDDYLRRVNATNLRNAPVVTRDASALAHMRWANAHATTAVATGAFRSGQDIVPHLMHVTTADVAAARVVPHPSVTPVADAAVGGRPRQLAPVIVPGVHSFAHPQGRQATPQPAPHPRPLPPSQANVTGVRRPLVTQRPAPAPNPPFEARAQAMQAHPGRPLEPQQIENVRAGRPPGPMRDPEVPAHPAPPRATEPRATAPRPKKD